LRATRRHTDTNANCKCDANTYTNAVGDASSNAYTENSSESQSSTDATPAPVEIIN
jgi:hypothetical protein